MYLRQVAKERLNPCFNGIQMEPMLISSSKMGLMCLNPCFNGIQMELPRAMKAVNTVTS